MKSIEARWPGAVGSMRGSCQLLDENGKHFDAPIAPFILAMPGSLH